MNKHENETNDSAIGDDHAEAQRRVRRKVVRETAFGDLEPRIEIKGGSLDGIHKVTDVTLKRGVIG